MDKNKIIQIIENFAPLETQETWDCSGWLVKTEKTDIKKIMLCLSITQNVMNQAKDCDMIISHHPLFYVPISWKDKDIYCAHTNFDLAEGGTTDCLIDKIFLNTEVLSTKKLGFLRFIDTNISVLELIKKLQNVSPNLRYVNPKNISNIRRIAFCSGSGSEFVNEAYDNGADALVTADIKFHTALDSPIALFDIGHFESEIISLKVFEELLSKCVDLCYAKESSPFKYLQF